MRHSLSIIDTAPKLWFRQAEAAAVLGVTTVTLARWRRAGRGPAFVDHGMRSIRYHGSDLAQWMVAHQTGGAE